MTCVAPLLLLALAPVARARAAAPLAAGRGRRPGAGGAALRSRPHGAAQHRDPVRHLRAHPAAPPLEPASTEASSRPRRIMGTGGILVGLAFALLPRRIAVVALPAFVALALAAFSYNVHGAIRDHSRAHARPDLGDQPELDRRATRLSARRPPTSTGRRRTTSAKRRSSGRPSSGTAASARCTRSDRQTPASPRALRPSTR